MVTAAIEFTNYKGLTTILRYVYGNRASDITTRIVTTEHTTELATGYNQGNVAINGSLLGTAIYFFYIVLGHTFQNNVYITIHIGMAAGTKDFAYIQICTVFGFREYIGSLLGTDICTTNNISLGVAATIDVVDITAQ